MDLQPVDFTTALGPLPDPLKAMHDEQATRLGLQNAALGNQALTQQLQARQDAMQRQQTFGADFSSYLAHPTTTGLVSLFGKYPEFHDQIKQAHDTLDEDQQRVNTTQLGSVAALAAKGDYTGAANVLRRRIDADKAAGLDTSDDQEILDHLTDPDPAKQKGALALTTIALAGTVGPERAAAFLKTSGLSSEPYTLHQGDVRYGSDNQVIASVAPKPDYLIIPEGAKAVPVGPGGPQPAGTIQGNPSAPARAAAPAPAGARRVHGYTPRQSNGGDNPDNVVDNKIAALSRAVGVDPDVPMTPEQFQTFVRALPATEGSGNNNPGGIKDGAFARRQPGYAGAVGQYAKFSTPEAGTQAMAKLLQNSYYAKGQTSIRDIIEGRPVGGQLASAPAAAPANPVAQPGDPAGTIYGNPKPQYRLLTPAEASARGLDPGKRWQVGPDGQTSSIGDAPVGSGVDIPGNTNLSGEAYLKTVPGNLATQVKALSEGRLPLPSSFAMSKPYWQRLLQMTAQYDPTFDAANAKTRAATRKEFTSGQAARNITSFNTALGHLDTLSRAADALNNSNWHIFNTIGNAVENAAGDPRITNFETAKQAVISELERAFRGSAGTLEGIRGWEKSINSSQSPEQLHAAIRQMATLLESRINALGEQYNAGMGRSSDPINLLDSHAQAVMHRLLGDPTPRSAPAQPFRIIARRPAK